MVFTKHNHSPFQDALLLEAAGLQRLREAIACDPNNPLRVPEALSVTEQQLQLTRIHNQRPGSHQWQQLGEGLALLHKQTQLSYGLNNDNYIGLNPQPNGVSNNWGQFFVQQRLLYQLSLITDSTLRNRWQTP